MKHRRRAQSNARWVIAIAALTGLIIGGVFLYLRIMLPVVAVTEAVEGPVVQAFYSTGTISPEREYPIRANVAGILTEVHVDKGDAVKKGDGLAVVTDPELQYLADRARAQLEEARKRAAPETSPVLREFDAKIAMTSDLLEIAEREKSRVLELMPRNAASQTDLDRALDRVRQLAGELESLKAAAATKKLELERDVKVAESALNIAQWNLEQQTFRAPIDGVVLDRPTALGTRVAINDQIMRIADVRPENLVMRAAVDEEDIAKVRKDQVVQMALYAFPGEILRGTVTKIFDQADPDRRTFEVEVGLDKVDPRLAPGMTGELAFVMASKDKAIVVPSQAVAADGSVFVVRDEHLSRVSPRIGIRSIERVEILEGLAPGARVVISPLAGLTDGQRVRTNFMDPVAAAGLNEVTVEEAPFKGFD